MKFYPYEKGGGGGGKSCSHVEGGGGGAIEVYLRWGTKSFHSLKGGRARNVLPCLEGGGQKCLRTHDFPIL